MTSVESNGKEELRDLFELDKCVNWIKKNNYTKVCLQFPDSLLSYSVDIALYIDKETNNKTFILGDTSYGSCCVDEVASRHVQGDAIIHFGHACLTNNNSIPVLYILTKKCLNVLECIDKIKPVLENGDTLILYDSGYSHLRNEIVQSIPERFKDSVVVSELVDGSASKQFCGKNCCLHDNKDIHSSLRFSRGFCGDSFKTAVYIGCDSLVDNFVLMLKDVQFYQYKESSDLCVLNSFQAYKKISFLIEKIKDAKKVGLIVGTLSVGKYLGAISHIKKLCKRRKKRVYIISVGKPTVAKLSNFPEIDVFAILSCPETSYLDSKTCMQPIVGLLELELALNENRTWDNTFSKDFRDLVEGGADFIQLPEGEPSDDLDVSLVTNKLQGIQGCTLTSQEIAVNPNMSLRTSDFSSRPRTWDGLQLTIGDTPVVKAEKGRSGTAQGYVTEGETINNCS